MALLSQRVRDSPRPAMNTRDRGKVQLAGQLQPRRRASFLVRGANSSGISPRSRKAAASPRSSHRGHRTPDHASTHPRRRQKNTSHELTTSHPRSTRGSTRGSHRERNASYRQHGTQACLRHDETLVVTVPRRAELHQDLVLDVLQARSRSLSLGAQPGPRTFLRDHVPSPKRHRKKTPIRRVRGCGSWP